MTPFVWFTLGLLVLVSAASVTWGRMPERIAAMASLGVTLTAYLWNELGSWATPMRILLLDGFSLAVAVLLALRYARWWLQLFAGFALLAFVSNVAGMLDETLSFYAIMTVVNIWGAAQLLVLGAAIELRRRSKVVDMIPVVYARHSLLLLLPFFGVCCLVVVTLIARGNSPREVAIGLLGTATIMLSLALLAEARLWARGGRREPGAAEEAAALSGNPATSE